jgi:hypothetical protein
MTKEEELIAFLHENLYDPILAMKDLSPDDRNEINRIIDEMNYLEARRMIQYFYNTLITYNEILYPRRNKKESVPDLNKIFEEIRTKYNGEWLCK